MTKSLIWPAFVALSIVSTTALAHGDDEHAATARTYDASKVVDRAFGREGNPKNVTRVVKLGMSDALRFTPAEITVKRGETIKFIVHNDGKQLHEMVLGTPEELKQHAEMMKKFPDMQHTDPSMAHVKPGAHGEIVWQFTKAGEYQFACLLPGHYEAGMVGKVTVK
jgi:uncharacterized cupredoxin-like copper-binding protein